MTSWGGPRPVYLSFSRNHPRVSSQGWITRKSAGRRKSESRANVKGEIFSPTPKQPQSASMPRRKVTNMTPMKKARKAAAKPAVYRIPMPISRAAPKTISNSGRILTTQTTESGDNNWYPSTATANCRRCSIFV